MFSDWSNMPRHAPCQCQLIALNESENTVNIVYNISRGPVLYVQKKPKNLFAQLLYTLLQNITVHQTRES